MNYNGLEIDMLSIGDADCILVTRWTQGVPVRVLIDGGCKDSYPTVARFLQVLGIAHLDHVVCSHPHDDHAGGLVELAKDLRFTIGHAWVHQPLQHVDGAATLFILMANKKSRAATEFVKSLQTVNDLLAILNSRGIPITEPFQGMTIGCLEVYSPTLKYYRELVCQFSDADRITAIDQAMAASDLAEQVLEAFAVPGASIVLTDNPETTPENNSSIVLATVYDGKKIVLTADAGAQALIQVVGVYNVAGCDWLQLPHHGSRRNLSPALIQHFSPRIAFVSATGSTKHPRRAVVNAFKELGTSVYSTHYPNGGHLWQHYGDVPMRQTYSAATPLWEANR